MSDDQAPSEQDPQPQTASDYFKALRKFPPLIKTADKRPKALRARRDALIARAVKSGLLSERDAAEAAGVSPSYAHKAAVGKTGATATLRKTRRRPSR